MHNMHIQRNRRIFGMYFILFHKWLLLMEGADETSPNAPRTTTDFVSNKVSKIRNQMAVMKITSVTSKTALI